MPNKDGKRGGECANTHTFTYTYTGTHTYTILSRTHRLIAMRALMKPDHPTCSCWGLGHDQMAGTNTSGREGGDGNTLSPVQYHHRTPAKLTKTKRWMDLIDPFFLPATSSRSLIVLKPSRQLVRPKSLELFVVSEFLFLFRQTF